jgi:hypothetical protein
MADKEQNKVHKTEYGYMLVWAEQKSHGGIIHVFEKPSKTDFVFHKEKEKSYFVNSGEFIFRWIDTQSGQVYQQGGTEGFVFTVNKMVPSSLECKSPNGSLTEANNGVENDTYVVLKKENIL